MSRLITTLSILLVLLTAAGKSSAQGYPDDAYGGNGGSASYQQFYDELSPYGDWINDPQYGYVWVPDAGNDFRPYYSDGYWTNTDYGNTWVSNYRWGWAPFHYGRWTYSSYYGWLWVPGNTWGPAWVSWRSGGGSYGWAPLGPGISVNVGIGGYSCPDYWWTFTPQQYVLSPNFHSYCYGPRYAPQYVHQTTIINNTYVYNHNTYISGPRRGDMERAIGRPVQPVAISNVRRPGETQLRGNNLNIYRPAIAESRPRTTERPRTFRNAEQPIATTVNGPRQVTPSFERGAREPGMRTQQQAPVRGNEPGTFQRDPRLQRPEPSVQSPAQTDRRFQQTEQSQRARDWGNRTPQTAPVQQIPEPRVERQPFDRGAEMQRAQEAQRVQETQRAEQTQRMQEIQRRQTEERFERPAPAAQERQPVQRVEQPRIETPRSVPQQRQEMPVQRQERQPAPGGDGGRGFRR